MKHFDDKITIKPQWDKTPDQVWKERFAGLTEDDAAPATGTETESETEGNDLKGRNVTFRRRMKIAWSVAATLALIVVLTATCYTKRIEGIEGGICNATLPDGSSVQIASGSEVSYKPIGWLVSHRVNLTGEAYFSGHHAKGFSVMTESGDIEVMGTSFDARTYDDQLIVTCIEGRVKVKTGGSQTELTANMEATGKDGKISTQTVPDGTCALGWTKGEFSFYNRPMEDVLRDVERCYDVKIGMPQELEHVRYTGRFPRGKSVQEVLKILGETFGTEFKIIP